MDTDLPFGPPCHSQTEALAEFAALLERENERLKQRNETLMQFIELCGRLFEIQFGGEADEQIAAASE